MTLQGAEFSSGGIYVGNLFLLILIRKDRVSLSSVEAPPDYGLFYQQNISLEFGLIKHGDGPPGLPLSGHLDEGKTFWLPGLSVPDDLDRGDISRFGEKGSDLRFAGLEGYIGNVNFFVHYSSYLLVE